MFIMFEFTPGALNVCAVACPTAAARTLEELGQQCATPEEWLFSNPEDRATIGLFSIDAVRTVVTNYDVAGPADHPRYGMAREYTDMTQVQLASMQRSVERGYHITPEDVASLGLMARERTAQRNAFAELPVSDQRRHATAAKPFLDEVAVSLLDKNPAFAELQELAAILKAREEKDAAVSLAGDLLASTQSIDRVYSLDQGPFLIARQALQACGGPMAYTKSRFILPGGYPFGTKRGNVCPNGSKRDMTYSTAVHQSE